MKLIIGGTGAGKLAYALEKYGLREQDVARDFEGAARAPVFYGLEHAVCLALEHGEDPALLMDSALEKNPAMIVICRELGAGVVPMDAAGRRWREATGRLCCSLAEKAEKVERIVCGIALTLKERPLELLLVRHGATPGNLLRRYVGSDDQPLSPQGEREADAARETVPAVELVYRSPMLRCRMTAERIFPESEKIIIEGLRETNFGDFEGRTYEELADSPAYQGWLAGGDPPNGESRAHADARAASALRELVRDARGRGLCRVAAVCHGGTIMSIMAAFAEDGRKYYDYLLPNCGHYFLDVIGETPVLKYHSEARAQ